MRWTGRSGFRTHLEGLPVGCLFILISLVPRYGLCQEKVQLFVDEVRFQNFPDSIQETVEPWGSALAAEVSGALEGAPGHTPVSLENLKAQLGKERLKATMACEDSSCVNRIVENFGCSETLFPVVRYISRSKAQVTVTHTADGEKVASRGPLVVSPTYESLTGALRSLSRDVMGLTEVTNGSFAVTPHAPIPEVTGPSEFRRKTGGMSFGEVNVEELEVYDSVARFDESDASAEKKARRWEGLAKAHPSYRDQALARAAEWREYARKQEAAERARKARASAMAKDWKKLSRLLELSVVSDEDKRRWAGEFIAAYGRDRSKNKYVDEMRSWIGGDDRDMVHIPAGPFLMGCNYSTKTLGCDISSWIEHKVDIDDFWMDRTEVTVAQYRRCVEEGSCSTEGIEEPYWGETAHPEEARFCNWGKTGRDDHPVNCVTWGQAAAYCAWLGKRLPTEAEWEKAARGPGNKLAKCGRPSCSVNAKFGNVFDETAGVERPNWDLWGKKGYLGYNDGFTGTSPVGSFPDGASFYGVLDMFGNVWEWVADWHVSEYYKNSPTNNPQGPTSGKERVVRGGSFYEYPQKSTIVYRGTEGPNERMGDGFRCASSTSMK